MHGFCEGLLTVLCGLTCIDGNPKGMFLLIFILAYI